MEEKYTNFWGKGMYKCANCGETLFESDAKFKSGTEWPSFREAMEGKIITKEDHSLGMERTEIVCAKCGDHLGHVFDDGKLLGDSHFKAGKRFCVLSDSLEFEENKKGR